MVGFGMSWAVGQLLTTLIAYFLPNWRHMQRVSVALPLITLPYYWLVWSQKPFIWFYNCPSFTHISYSTVLLTCK